MKNPDLDFVLGYTFDEQASRAKLFPRRPIALTALLYLSLLVGTCCLVLISKVSQPSSVQEPRPALDKNFISISRPPLLSRERDHFPPRVSRPRPVHNLRRPESLEKDPLRFRSIVLERTRRSLSPNALDDRQTHLGVDQSDRFDMPVPDTYDFSLSTAENHKATRPSPFTGPNAAIRSTLDYAVASQITTCATRRSVRCGRTRPLHQCCPLPPPSSHHPLSLGSSSCLGQWARARDTFSIGFESAATCPRGPPCALIPMSLR